MLEDLPVFIEPKRLALRNTRLKGYIALGQMLRLQDSLYEPQGDTYIDWLFTTDEQQRLLIEGVIQTQLPLQCQRCLQRLLWSINTKVALIVLPAGQTEEDITSAHEVLTLTATPVSLATLVEDELLLALPIVPKHAVCPSNDYQLSESFEEDSAEHYNPFQVLSKLKKPD